MDQRKEPRIKADRQVKVTTIGVSGGGRPGKLDNSSGGGAGLLLAEEIAPGTLVKVEWDQTMVLGEVTFCKKLGEEYFVGLQLKHALYHVDELAALAERLRGEDAETRPNPAMAGILRR